MRWALLGFAVGWLLHGWYQRNVVDAQSGGSALAEPPSDADIPPAAAFAQGPVESSHEPPTRPYESPVDQA